MRQRSLTLPGALTVAAALACAPPAGAQSILTVAGGRVEEGRAATSIVVSDPHDVVVARNGDVYVSASLNNRVLKIAGDTGILSVVAGNGNSYNDGDGGPAPLAGVEYPIGLALDASGNLYIACYNQYSAGSAPTTIRKVDAQTGKISTVARVSDSRCFYLAVDSSGNLYTGDSQDRTVKRINPAGGVVEIAGNGSNLYSGDGGPARQAGLGLPYGVALDGRGGLLVAAACRVRRIDLATSTITTVAGTGSCAYAGDGGPATAAGLSPIGVRVDAAGNIYISELDSKRIRRVDAVTGIVTTVAGNGSGAYSGDGGPATEAGLAAWGLAIDAQGNVLAADESNNRVRRIDAATGVITTVAGTGAEVDADTGEGLPATAISLLNPGGIAVDPAGNIFVTQSLPDYRFAYSFLYNLVRRIDAETGVITTVAGSTGAGFSGDGGPATAAKLRRPSAVRPDSTGNLYIVDSGNRRVRRVDAETGIITTVAGGGPGPGNGDGGPATLAVFKSPSSLAIDEADNLFIADTGLTTFPEPGGPAVVRRVDARTGVITTVAGGGNFFLDGRPATATLLDGLEQIAVDENGNLYITTEAAFNGYYARVRKVDAATALVSTVAGGETSRADAATADGIPATQATISGSFGLTCDRHGGLYFSESGNFEHFVQRVRRVDLATGIVTTVAGKLGNAGFAGDGGPATAATLYYPGGIAVRPNGDLFFVDSNNARIRAVFACRDQIGSFAPAFPDDGAVSSALALNLGWTRSESAFRYDAIADAAFPPKEVQASVSGLGVQLPPGSLRPGATYFWQVRARGDPNCQRPAERTSALRRFTAARSCAPPAPPALDPVAPGAAPTLSFGGAAGAASFDVYLGTGASLPLAAAGLTSRSFTPSLAPGRYRWRVVARAACDAGLTTTSEEGSFEVPGSCAAPPPPDLLSPPHLGAPRTTAQVLSWRPDPAAASYDLYLGPADPPPLLAAGLTSASCPVTLEAGRAYSWRVVSHAACDPQKTASSATQAFTTAPGCLAPSPPGSLSATSAPIGASSTYVLSWTPSPDLPAGGAYRVERAPGADFASGAETVTTLGTSLLFAAGAPGSYSHRVSAVAPCGASSLATAPATATVSAGSPVLVMTRAPRATVIRQLSPGSPLPRLELEVRNVGGGDFTGFFSTSQPTPFFQMSEAAFSLRAGETRVFFVQLTGVPTDRAGAYEGVVSIASADPNDTNAYPQASVSLTITSTKPGDPEPSGLAAPALETGSPPRPVELIALPPAPPGESPAPATVQIRNAGTSPLELAADVAPDAWIGLPPAWSSAPIPPGASRALVLNSQRIRAGNSGGFPRAAYVTFRTADGKSSRLLVEDSDVIAAGAGPARSPLAAEQRSLLVPSLVNAPSLNGSYVSRLLLTNLGADPLQADLFYTPDIPGQAVSGLDAARVLAATVVVPAGDVAALTDPVGRIFGTQGSGQLEVRSSRIGALRVQSVVDAPAAGGGSFGFQLPTVKSGDGARAGRPYAVAGVVQNGAYRTNVLLAETSGEPSSVTLALFDKAGSLVGSTRRDLPPYAKQQLSVRDLAAATLDAGALEITANDGSAGSVVAVTTVIDNLTGDASSFVARPLRAETASTSYAVASVVYTATFQSRLELRNNDTRPAAYRLTYRGSTGTVESASRTLAPRQEDAFDNVLADVFGLPAGTFGPLAITSDTPNLQIVSRVYAPTPGGTYGDAIEGVALDDPGTTGESGRILATDGLEGTADGDRSRGARTNLIMTEIAGGSAVLEVSLWEKSRKREAPVARRTYAFGPYQQIQLNDVFATLGLGQRDRLNVLCQVRPLPGATGRVVALATRIDNRTNDTKNLVLVP